MRWFKHMTNTGQDEKIAKLISEHGHASYAIWWLVCEAVAARVEKGSQPTVTYPVTKWSHLLSLRGSHVRQALLKLAVTGLVTAEWNGSDITVTIPNLLKYRDEYSRKSGHAPENVRSKDTDTDTDTDIPPIPPEPSAPVITEIAQAICKRHPRRKCSVARAVVLLGKISQRWRPEDREAKLRKLDERHSAWCRSPDWTKDNYQYTKSLEAWLNPVKELYEIDPEPAQTLFPIKRRLC